ncbi:MAG: bacterial extracellular solute-binding protein [uncultured archaeon A07HR60]|nr:MAG: bacterial extracellular solute-binding protein [uncultured archaeon A07HR60]
MATGRGRRWFLSAAGTGVAVGLAGCTGNQPENSGETTSDAETNSGGDSDETAKAGGTLRLTQTGNVESVDPVNKGTGGVNQWGETLLNYDNGLLPPVTNVASDVEVLDGGQTYRFTLKEGVRFHDGTELTASDIVYSWERIAGADNSQNADDIIGGTFTVEHEKAAPDGDEEAGLDDYIPGSLAVRAPEKYVFEFDMREAYHGSLEQIASESTFMIIPENTVGDIERDDIETEGQYAYQEAFGTDGDGPLVAGTGPFQIDSWQKGDTLAVSRFDDYHGQTATIDGIEYTILSGSEAAYQRALNGNVDVFEIPDSKFDVTRQANLESVGGGRQVGTYELESGQSINHAQIEELGTDTLLFNANRVPLAVRQAVAAMLNIDDIAENIYPNQTPAYSYTPPQAYPNLGDFASSREAQVAHYTDGAMAQTEFGESGYRFGIGESQMDRARGLIEDAGLSGESYTLTIPTDVRPEVWGGVATRIQQKGNSIGIDVTIERADYGTIISQGVFETSLDFYTLGDSMEVPAPDNMLRFYNPQTASGQAAQWGDQADDGSWATDVQQAAADAWAENYLGHRGDSEKNQRLRNKAYLTIEEAMWQEVPILPTVHRVTREFWSDDVDYTPPGVQGDKTYNEITISR